MESTSASQSPQDTTHGTSNKSTHSTAGASSANKLQTTVTPPRIRRRNRLITSCLECRRRKLKCDKLHPCSNCTKWNRDCVFLAPALDPTAQSKLAKIKEQMGTLEKTLEEDVARSRKEAMVLHGSFTAEALSPDDDKELKELEPTPLALADTVYEGDADDDFLDLGVQLGKLRITERIGGLARPKFGEELSNTMQDPYYNPIAKNQPKSPSETSPEPIIPFQGASYVGPSPDYIAPSSSFFFAPEPSKSSLIDFLPSKAAADKLLAHYWLAAHTIARIVYRPSFETQYERFWDNVSVGVEPPNSLQAIVMAMFFTSVVSMTDDQVIQEFACQRSGLVENFRLGSEMALAKSSFLRTTKLETIQAFVMYLIPLCRAEVSRAHSALTGTAIRLAECMGLHRDGSYYGLPPVETHVRRLIWFQLCYLDIRTCESSGPRPQIRTSDDGGFDTKFPLNIDEEGLLLPDPPKEDARRWTDMTLPLMRMRANEVQRLIWQERVRVEERKTNITSVLGRLQRARQELDARFLPLIDETVPVQLLAKHVYHIITDRWHITFLNRYHTSVAHRMPDRLRQLMLAFGTAQVESSIAVDTHPFLAPWRWYSGALQQYHVAVLLLFEIYANPMHKEADRIWACLDYVFDIPTHLNRDQKAKLVFNEFSTRMNIYHSLRKTRAPVQMERMVGIKAPRRVGDGHRLDQQANAGMQMPPQLVSQTYTSRGESSSPNPTSAPISGSSPAIDYNFNSAPGANAMSGTFGAMNTGTLEQLYVPEVQGDWSPQALSNSSDSGSVGAGRMDVTGGTTPLDLQAVMDIDWNEFDMIFPPDQLSGDNILKFNYGAAVPSGNMDVNTK